MALVERAHTALRFLLIPVLVLVAWQVLGSRGVINTAIMSDPADIGSALLDMAARGTLAKHVGVSLLRVAEGFALGAGAGVLLGMIVATVRPAERYLASLIGILRPIPAIALVPLLILWFGIGEESKVAVITIGSFWPVLINTIHGIQSVDRQLLEVGRVLRKSRATMLLRIVLPAAMPSIFTGLRLGIGSAWTCVVTAEMIAASSGVGYLITYAREIARPDMLFVGIASIGLFGLIIDTLVLALQRRLFAWQETEASHE